MRRWVSLGAARGLAIAAVFFAAAGPVLAVPDEEGAGGTEPAPCPEITRLVAFALGWQSPLVSPGKPVPVVFVGAWGDGLIGEGTKLRGSLETSTLAGSIEMPVAGRVAGGLSLSGTFQSAQGAPYRYEGGRRSKALEIDAHEAGGSVFQGLRLSGTIEARASLGVRRLFYGRRGTTAADLTLPADHTELFAGLELTADRMTYFQDWQVAEGWDGALRARYVRRDAWRAWGRPGEPQTRPGAHREGAWIAGEGRWALRWLGNHDLRFGMQAGVAWDADVLSGFRAGSLVGSPSLPGTYYGELACDRYLFVEGRIGMNLWAGARGSLRVKGGGIREIGGPVRGAAGISVGLTQRVFFGMPVTLEYGYSPTAKRDGFGGGHELYLMAAGAIQ